MWIYSVVFEGTVILLVKDHAPKGKELFYIKLNVSTYMYVYQLWGRLFDKDDDDDKSNFLSVSVTLYLHTYIESISGREALVDRLKHVIVALRCLELFRMLRANVVSVPSLRRVSTNSPARVSQF